MGDMADWLFEQDHLYDHFAEQRIEQEMKMALPIRTPRAPIQGAAVVVTSGKSFSLGDITTKSDMLPNRNALYAGIGFGKTSIAAQVPSPVFIMTRGETGLETLMGAGQLAETPHFPEIKSWEDLLAAVRFLRKEEHSFKTLVLDTANGAERMMHEMVCERDYNGDWDSKDFGFLAWGGKGYDTALADWRLFLNLLDDLRRDRGMTIFFLLHSRVKTFKNPSGADYDRYMPEMNDKTWTLTKGWLDNIFFGNFEVVVMTGQKEARADRKGKAADTTSRILYTNAENPIIDAKNRLGLPAEIDMGTSPQQGWENLSRAIKDGRKVTQNG